jgi:spore coat protein H
LFSASAAIAQVPHYDIRMDPALYDTLYMRDIFSDVYLPTQSLDYEGVLRTDAQIKFKGHSTRYYPKKSYRLKFSSNFQNVRQINLNSMYTDKSFIRESLCWLLYADIHALAPGASHATATINGNYKGLFLQVDKVDKYFLQKRGRAQGPMFEADDYYVSADLTVQPDSLLKLYYAQVIGDSNDYNGLRAMILALNDSTKLDFPALLDTLFDVRSVLNWFAGNIFVMEGDSYNKNYLLYRDTTRTRGQWTFIPWDYDVSLGRNGDEGIPYPASLLNDGFVYTFGPLSGSFSVLKKRFMDSPALMERLRGYLDTLLTEAWTEERIHNRIDSLAAVVRPYVQSDPDKWGTYQDFQEHIEVLKYYVTARRNYLLSTFIHPPTGQYNTVTIYPTRTGTPYHCLTYDGRQIATFRFTSIDGLDSLYVRARPDSTPPDIASYPSRGYVRRWLQIVPYPSTAKFTATLQWMWMDFALDERELSPDVQDERLLGCAVYRTGNYQGLVSRVNAYGNFVTVEGLTVDDCGSGKYLALLMPATYTQKWYRHPSHFWQRWYDVAVKESGRVVVVGEHGSALTSIDSGKSWSEYPIGVNLSFFGVEALGGDSVIACGESGSMYVSTNFGSSWVQIPLQTRSAIHSVVSSTDGTLWASGRGVVLRSTDRGTTWSPSVPDSTVDFKDVLPFSSLYSLSVGDSGRVFSTTDGGQNWSATSAGTAATLSCIGSIAGRHVWAAGDSGKIIVSSDSGKTWVQKVSPVMVNWKALYLEDSLRVFVAGEGGVIFFTPDGGAHWYRQYSADSHDLYALRFADTSYGIAVGNGGTILLTDESGTVTAMGTLARRPEAFRLEQNFPNPFNPTTGVNYELPVTSDVRLVVYDILGREVAVLVNEKQGPGRYEVRFGASGLASGVYLYRLTAGGSIQTRKMLLVR